MVKRHLKTLTVPRSWPVERKGQKFIVRPRPGKSYEQSIPLSIVFKNLLKYCKTMKEVKTLLQDKEVLIDGKRRKDPRSSMGFMDVLTLVETKENYRMGIDKNKRLHIYQIPESEAGLKLVKIIGKTVLKKGVVQLNLSDGRNLNLKKDDYAVGQSLVLELPSQKIKDSLKLEKGAAVLLIGGKHVGEQGNVKEILAGKDSLVTIKTESGDFETPRGYVFVVGKDKTMLKIE